MQTKNDHLGCETFLFIESKGLLNAEVELLGHFAALSSLDISQTIICLSFRMIILHNFVVRRLLKLKSACPRHSDLEDHHQPLREEPARHEGKAPAKHRPSLSPGGSCRTPGGSRGSPVGAVRPPLVPQDARGQPQDRRGRCRPHTALPPPRLGARPPPFTPQRRASRLRANGSREKGG